MTTLPISATMRGMATAADLVTTAEAARILGKTISTVNRWATIGVLTPAVKAPGLRGANLYDRADVLALLVERAA